jgi:acyl-CoA reductase-like NAD-dependent aldehyde dehydrogenase
MTPFSDEVVRCRPAQAEWARLPIRERLRRVLAFRHLLVSRTDDLTAAVEADVRRPPDELIATDIIPTAAAAKFLERQAASILAPRKVGGRPLWLMGCRDVVHRRPRGVVGLIGTWNYPVFLNAIPILHAVAAGNGVLWKPSEHAPRTAAVLHEMFVASGFPADLIQTLPATREAGPQLAEAEIDFLHFTGSEPVGRKLAARLGERMIPSTLELSGCDAMFVFRDAAVERAAKLAWYGATLNAGQTCMAVRRAFVERDVYEAFVSHLRPFVKAANPVSLVTPGEGDRLREIVRDAKALGCDVLPGGDAADVRPTVILNPRGARNLAANRAPVFAPLVTVTPFDGRAGALDLFAETQLRLTASIFTADVAAAQAFAAELSVGAVTVNDVIVPTAHPETPFGGRAASGWGVTQGVEGLLEMTVPQVVTVRGGSFRPHAENAAAQRDITRGYLRLAHGAGWRERWRGLRQLLGGVWRRA